MRYAFIISIVFLSFCNKREFLAASPSSNFEAPSSLNHLLGLLNNELLMAETPILGEQSADDYFLQENYYEILPALDKRIYTWEKDVYLGKHNIADWNLIYSQILNCNIVLEQVDNIEVNASLQTTWNKVKGSALFMRSFSFFNLSQVFAQPYDAATASDTPGIVLALTSKNDVIYSRASLQETYGRVIDDLLLSIKLLPSSIDPQSRNLPNKPAAYALLARVFLSMRNYEKAAEYADSCLSYHSELVDFNTLDLAAKFPMPALNEETFYQSNLISTSNVIQGRSIPGCVVDSVLYNSYDANDLRREVFFMQILPGKPNFRGNYSGKTLAFSGLASDEVWLIRAECKVKEGKIAEAIAGINQLLEKRYKTGTFSPYPTDLSQQEALALVRNERRKELFFRGLRWSDLRRYNKEEANITLRRKIAGIEYMLLPNDKRFVLPIPGDALISSNIVQNPR